LQEKKSELDAMLEEHLEETKGLHEEFTQAQELLVQRNSQLQAEFDDLATRFKNRASRDEDLEVSPP
jgi:hypothetical protein